MVVMTGLPRWYAFDTYGDILSSLRRRLLEGIFGATVLAGNTPVSLYGGLEYVCAGYRQECSRCLTYRGAMVFVARKCNAVQLLSQRDAKPSPTDRPWTFPNVVKR